MSTMPGDRKKWAVNEEAQEKLAKGIQIGADAVANTLGPAAKNTLIDRKGRTPMVVDDGKTTIDQLILDDELENLGVLSLVDAANKASEHVGDGTSHTIILTRALYEEGIKLTGSGGLMLGKTPYEIWKEIREAKDLVVEKLKEKSKEIKTRDEIKSVALAAYADENMADVVADICEQVGENGVVLVEDGWGRETETEVITGMRKAVKLAHGFFVNGPDDTLKLENHPILVSDFDFVNLNDIRALVGELLNAGEPGVVIMANRYERAAIDQVIKTDVLYAQQRSPFRIWLVKAPSFTPGEWEDFAIYVGARYISKEQGDKIIEATPSDLGKARSLKIDKIGDAIILGGDGTQEDVDKRIEELKVRLEAEKVKMVKNVITQRIASLASAIGIIKVASPSDGETEQIRMKTRNAVKSVQAAIKEGAVRGGGLTLKEISEELPEDNILKKPLLSIHETIQRNAGGKGIEMPDDLYDATKVIRTAIEQACSQAHLLINTATIIAFRTDRDIDDAMKRVADKMKE